MPCGRMLECTRMETRVAAPQAPWRLIAWLVFVLALTALNVAGRLAADETDDEPAYSYATSVGFVVQGAIMIGILLLIARGLPPRESFALRRPASWPAATGYAAAALAAIWVVSIALSPFLDATDEQGLVPEEWDSSKTGAFIAFFVSATIVAPLVEELTFRGLGFGLLEPYGAWTAILVTGCLFGAVHGLVAGFPLLATFGILLAWLRMKTGSVYPPMLLHGIFNGVALIVSVTLLG